MQIELTGHHCEITDSLRDYVNEKIGRLNNHFDGIMDAHVVLTVEKQTHKAEATLNLKGNTLFANVENSDMYASIDALTDKLERQVQKHKGKIKDHRSNIPQVEGE